MHRFLGLSALYEAGGNQPFDDTGTGCRRSQPLAFGIVGHLLCARRLHSGEQGVLGKVSRGFGFAFLDFGAGHLQLPALGKFGEHLAGLFLILVGFPAQFQDGLALGGKGSAAAHKFCGGFTELAGSAHRTKYLLGNHHKDFSFPSGERSQIRLAGYHCGDDGVVVGNLFAIADLLCMDGHRLSLTADPSSAIDDCLHAVQHIVSQITAVRSGVGAELLLIQTLHIVQGLLRREAVLPVGLPLQSGQIIEGRRFLALFLECDRLYDGISAGLGHNRCHIRLVRILFTFSGEGTKVQNSRVKRLGLKGVDLRLPLDQDGQRGGNHTPYIQGTVVQDGKQAGGIDAHQPVRPLTAAGGGKEVIVLLSLLQLPEALLNGGILHGGNPEAADGLAAPGHLVDVAEDKLSLTACVAGVDDLRHILPIHQLFQHRKLTVLVAGDFVLPVGRNDGQVTLVPLGVLLIVGIGIGQLCQMPEAPGHDGVMPLQIPLLAVLYAQNSGDGHSNRGLLSNHNSFCHGRLSPYRFSLAPAARGAFSDISQRRGQRRCPRRHRPELPALHNCQRIA